jgi:hypothetical protein
MRCPTRQAPQLLVPKPEPTKGGAKATTTKMIVNYIECKASQEREVEGVSVAAACFRVKHKVQSKEGIKGKARSSPNTIKLKLGAGAT